jgi:regulatory protein
MGGRQRLSLKGQALKYLALREHSRTELRRKMVPHAKLACASAAEADPVGHPQPSDEVGPCLDKLLDWLESNGLLSQERFVESRVRTRAPRFGTSRIRQELAQHGVSLTAEQRADLDRSEYERALQVWARKFQDAPKDAAARAKQMRFLAARGFASDAIRRVVWARSASGGPVDDTGPDEST